MFQVNDIVVHIHRGAGRILNIESLACLGSDKKYYAIELLDGTKTRVWVSLQDAGNGELRPTISKVKLDQVWRVLSDQPNILPTDHNERYAIIKESLDTGDIFQVAETLRDLTWKNETVRKLTSEGRRLYQRSLDFLVSEMAVVKNDTSEMVQDAVKEFLRQNINTVG